MDHYDTIGVKNRRKVAKIDQQIVAGQMRQRQHFPCLTSAKRTGMDFGLEACGFNLGFFQNFGRQKSSRDFSFSAGEQLFGKL